MPWPYRASNDLGTARSTAEVGGEVIPLAMQEHYRRSLLMPGASHPVQRFNRSLAIWVTWISSVPA